MDVQRMLNTFENAERQHLRRKDREKNLQTIEHISRNALFLSLDQTNLAPAADALNGVSLTKNQSLPSPRRVATAFSSSGARRGGVFGASIVVCFVTAILLGSLLSVPIGKEPTDHAETDDSTQELARYNHLFSLILDWGLTPRDELETKASASHQALEWLAFDDRGYDNAETLRTRFALATLYFSTHRSESRKWINENHWLSSYPVCLWHGVTCRDESDTIGLVKAVNLSANALEGELPREIALLQRDIQSIDLSSNSIGGTIPDLSPLKNILHLYLGPNEFVSSIPSSVYQLSHLTHLYLNDCRLKGKLDKSIAQLSNLQGLGLHNNQFTGPVPAEIGTLTDLRVCYLDGNLFSGKIPSVLPSKLVDLRLRRNKLQGAIPKTLATARFLQILYLDNNELEGSIPADVLLGLPLLLEVHLYNNRLTGHLPSELAALALLNTIYLDGNLLSGSIPSEWGMLRYLDSLYLFENFLTGSIPSSFGHLESLTHLKLDKNELSGDIPNELGRLSELETLYLNNNARLGSGTHGTIPLELGNLSNLHRARFHNTQLIGSMSPLCSLKNDLIELTSDCDSTMQCDCALDASRRAVAITFSYKL